MKHALPNFGLFPREDARHPDNMELRRIWWRCRRDGHQLPAERNVIVIRGVGL